MDILMFPWVGFVVVFLAALLVFGEMLVKAKGVFSIIGGILFVLYFIYHLDQHSPTLMIGLLAGGLALIIIDGKLIANGSVAALGVILMMLACALPTPSLLYGMIVSIGFVLGLCGSFVFIKIFPPRNYWRKLTLLDQLTSDQGYNSINESYKDLVGKAGQTATPFRPVGTVKVDGKSYSAISNGVWLDTDEEVKIIAIDGTRIVIEKVK